MRKAESTGATGQYVLAPKLGYRNRYDYQKCNGEDALKKTLAHINDNGFELICVCYDGESWFIFFRGAVYG